MPTVNELSDEKLEQYILKYKKRLEQDPSDTDASKKLNAVERELKNRRETQADTGTAVTETQTTSPSEIDVPKGEIQKFHTDDEDISTYTAATFRTRFLAAIIDGVLLYIVNQIIAVALAMALSPSLLMMVSVVLSLGLQYGYYVTMTFKTGQTLGKKVMKIKVVSTEGPTEPTLVNVFIRETVGKFISGLVFLLGYLWVAFGKEAWHDSMAKTTVVKLN